jgi:hypothetical protein
MSTPFEHSGAAVEKAAVTALGWVAIQIVGCVVTAIALTSVATLVSRYLFAGI